MKTEALRGSKLRTELQCNTISELGEITSKLGQKRVLWVRITHSTEYFKNVAWCAPRAYEVRSTV